mmetsp:Transcript_17807/g.35711  ORF Transcript_17807/g.35711 Transcript_17807/m.35711 type:complete len:84 (-) Transcript_17807:38-289(-)
MRRYKSASGADSSSRRALRISLPARASGWKSLAMYGSSQGISVEVRLSPPVRVVTGVLATPWVFMVMALFFQSDYVTDHDLAA